VIYLSHHQHGNVCTFCHMPKYRRQTYTSRAAVLSLVILSVTQSFEPALLRGASCNFGAMWSRRDSAPCPLGLRLLLFVSVRYSTMPRPLEPVERAVSCESALTNLDNARSRIMHSNKYETNYAPNVERAVSLVLRHSARQPAASPDGLWSRPSHFNYLALR